MRFAVVTVKALFVVRLSSRRVDLSVCFVFFSFTLDVPSLTRTPSPLQTFEKKKAIEATTWFEFFPTLVFPFGEDFLPMELN